MKKRVNCTTIFLMPGIGLARKDILKYGFLSAFIDDKQHSIHKDSVYLLFRPEDIESFQLFLEKEYKRTPLLVEDYDYEGGYVISVYKFPSEFIEEYNLFLQGKYSKFGEAYIGLFPKKVSIIKNGKSIGSEFSLSYHIFTRSSIIKKYWEKKIGEEIPDDMELWSAPDIEKETLDINQFKDELLKT